LIGRHKHPILNITDEQKKFIENCKKKIGIGLIFLIIGAILCIWGIILM
jgi:hypothetical protein